QSRLSDLEINQKIIEKVGPAGLNPAAIPDAIGRARQVFQLRDGQVIAIDPDNQTVRQGKNGPLTVEEWCAALKTEAPHLFASPVDPPRRRAPLAAPPSTTPPDSAPTAAKLKGNPFQPGPTWNITEQMRLQRNDSSKANELKLEVRPT